MSCTTTTSTTTIQTQNTRIFSAISADDVQTIRSYRLLTLSTVADLYGNNVIQMAYLMDSPNVFNYLIRENQLFDGNDLLQHVNHRGDNIYNLCVQHGDVQTISTLHKLDKDVKQKTIDSFANKIRSLEADNTRLTKENDKLQTINNKNGNAIRELKQSHDEMEVELNETKCGLKRKCEELDVEKEKVEQLRKVVKSNQDARKK
jgi:hypothetical protein